MADENPMGCAKRDLPLPADEDTKVERVVLSYLLDEHPNRLTVPEVSHELNAGETDFGREDAVERAIRDLVGAGLLHCCSGFILPTRAALYYQRLAV